MFKSQKLSYTNGWWIPKDKYVKHCENVARRIVKRLLKKKTTPTMQTLDQKHFFLRDGKLFVMQEMPKEPSDAQTDYSIIGIEKRISRLGRYNQALDKAKEQAIEVDNQDEVKEEIENSRYQGCTASVNLQDGEIYSLSGCKMEVRNYCASDVCTEDGECEHCREPKRLALITFSSKQTPMTEEQKPDAYDILEKHAGSNAANGYWSIKTPEVISAMEEYASLKLEQKQSNVTSLEERIKELTSIINEIQVVPANDEFHERCMLTAKGRKLFQALNKESTTSLQYNEQKQDIESFLKSSGDGEYRLVVQNSSGYIHPFGRDGQTLDFKL